MKKIFIGFLLFLSALCGIFAAGCEKKPQILDAPQNIRVENNVLIWDEVENASGYVVFYSDEEHETTEPRYDFSDIENYEPFHVEILAVGDGKNYLNSDWAKYVCTLNDLSYGVLDGVLDYKLTSDKTGYTVSLNKSLAIIQDRKEKENLPEEIYIPDYFEGLPVKEIGSFGITCSSGLASNPEPNDVTKSIRLPSHLEKIRDKAFYLYTSLTEIQLPNKLTTIEIAAFEGCTRLAAPIFPETLKTIGNSAFKE